MGVLRYTFLILRLGEMMSYMDLHSHQEYVEKTFSKYYAEKRVKTELRESKEIQEAIRVATQLIKDWMQEDFYDSKNQRLKELASRDIGSIVERIVCVTAPINEPRQFTEVVGLVAGSLNFNDKVAGVKTAAELVAIISDVQLYKLFKNNIEDPLLLVSNIQLEPTTLRYIELSQYLPPMVVPPRILKKNFDKAHLLDEHCGSLILGKGTHHEGDICLDSLNKFNDVTLSLNKNLLVTFSETPKKPLKDENKRQWLNFVKNSYDVYRDLIQTGNRFYLAHKVDKRGRTYAQGYHVSTQGNDFRKAIVELADKEVIS